MIETTFTHFGVLCAFLYYFVIDFANRKTCLTLHRYNIAWFTSEKTKFFQRGNLVDCLHLRRLKSCKKLRYLLKRATTHSTQKDLSLNNFFESWTVEMLFWIPSLFEIFTRNTTFFTALLARWWFSQLSQTSFTFKVKLIFCCENVLKSHLFIRSSFIYNPFLYNLQYAKENCMLRGIFQEQTIRKSRATPLFLQHKYMILFLPPPPHHQITRIFLLTRISQLTATTT